MDLRAPRPRLGFGRARMRPAATHEAACRPSARECKSLTGDERRKLRPHQPLFLFGRCFLLSRVDVLKVPPPRVDSATPIFGPDRRPGALLELRQDAVDILDVLSDIREELVHPFEAAKNIPPNVSSHPFRFFPELAWRVRQFFRFRCQTWAVEQKQAQLLGVLARIQVFPLRPRAAGCRLGRAIVFRQLRPIAMADQADDQLGLIDGALDRLSIGQGVGKIPLDVDLRAAMLIGDLASNRARH